MKKKYNSKWVDKLKKEFLIEQYIDLRKPMQEIANEVGCDKSTVNFYIMKENIEKRNNSESHKKENLRILGECKGGDIKLRDIFVFSGKMQDIGCGAGCLFNVNSVYL